MSVADLLTIFSPNVWVYSSLRFLTGLFRSSVLTTVLVLLMERVGRCWRGRVGIMGFVCFTLGLLSLPLIAYLERTSSWRTLYVWTSIPAIAYCILTYFFVYESPRWLFMQGCEIEAMAVIKKLAPRNSASSDLCFSKLPPPKEVPETNFYASIKSLFERKWALRRLLAVTALGFGVGMVYNGMLLGVGNLGFNTYLSLALNGILDIPSYFLTYFIVERFNRRSSILVFSIVSGVCSIICGIFTERKGIQIGLELVSFFAASVAFNLLLISATEMFPASVRNSASSMVRQGVLSSTVICPLLIAAGRRNEFLCYGVFGIDILCRACSVAFFPETRGYTLCDTLDEQERQDNGIRKAC